MRLERRRADRAGALRQPGQAGEDQRGRQEREDREGVVRFRLCPGSERLASE